MISAKPPKFCARCGFTLVPFVMEDTSEPNYDIYNGKRLNPNTYNSLRCPEYDYKGLGGHDNWFYSNQYSRWLRSV